MDFLPHQEMALATGASGLFDCWSTGGLPEALSGKQHVSAQLDLQVALRSGDREEIPVAPFWKAVGQTPEGGHWLKKAVEQIPDANEARLFQEQVSRLVRGQAQVVVTGQQPGFMGGPLYTLYKAATTIVLARQRTELGMPTVPVFWAGDDDDDLVEATRPVTWDPREKKLFSHDGNLKPFLSRGGSRPCVGHLQARQFSLRAHRWLETLDTDSPGTESDQSLSSLWAEALEKDWTWGTLFRRFLGLAFSGQGLIVVSGNDPFLHGSAAPLYRSVLGQREKLASLATRRGQEIDEQGFAVPLSDRSVHRHLFQTEGLGRAFVEPGDHDLAAHLLRPGVLLRSPVQDWLFEPAAVVVGPGELAYLNQLLPIYEHLKIPRSPLVPRMFGSIVPEGFDPEDPANETACDPDNLAQEVVARSRSDIARTLIEELGVAESRAADLATGRSRRLQKSLETLFRQEAEKVQQGRRAHIPAWIAPHGQRQERSLSSAGALAIWKDPLIEGLLSGARHHLLLGLENNWQEFQAIVPELTGVENDRI